ncbi:MAG: HisS family protein [Elusimicrobiota bacterium]
MGTNASIPKGTRDFAPDVVRKRTYILDILKNILEKYGFQPLETPAIENLETLTGKYGEDGDKLIFKILNNGLDNPAKGQVVQEEWQKVLQGKSSRVITERALRYDLTVPFARFVAMNCGQLVFPFKRYQIQNVWRADRPQKGRYREFCQCDIDVAGSASLFNEVELLQIYGEAFTRLAFPDFKLVVNNRKVLAALAAVAGCGPRLADLTTALDKIDKIGLDKVTEELKGKDFTESQIEVIKKYLSIEGSNEKRLLAARELLATSETGLQGLTELEFVLNFPAAKFKDKIVFEPALVRGLNYYTGTIFEAKPPAAVKIGSTGGGGRYDDLTSIEESQTSKAWGSLSGSTESTM